MATKPTVNSFATDSSASVQMPTTSYLNRGFTISQPPVNFMNWIIKNLYDWIRYLEEEVKDQQVTVEGIMFNHTHDTNRKLIELPFTFDTRSLKSQVLIRKLDQQAVGGTSSTVWSGSGRVTITVVPGREAGISYSTGTLSHPLLTVTTTSDTAAGLVFQASSKLFAGKTNVLEGTINTNLFTVTGTGAPISGKIRLNTIAIKRSGGVLSGMKPTLGITDDFLNRQALVSMLNGKNWYLVAAQSLSEATKGNAIIYNMSSATIPSYHSKSDRIFFTNSNTMYKFDRVDENISHVTQTISSVGDADGYQFQAYDLRTGTRKSSADLPRLTASWFSTNASSWPTSFISTSDVFVPHIDDTYWYLAGNDFSNSDRAQRWLVWRFNLSTGARDTSFELRASFTNTQGGDSIFFGGSYIYIVQGTFMERGNDDETRTYTFHAFNTSTGAASSSNNITSVTLFERLRDINGLLVRNNILYTVKGHNNLGSSVRPLYAINLSNKTVVEFGKFDQIYSMRLIDKYLFAWGNPTNSGVPLTIYDISSPTEAVEVDYDEWYEDISSAYNGLSSTLPTGLRYFRSATNFTRITAQAGSTTVRGGSVDITNAAGFDITSYTYDAARNRVVLVLSGTVTKTSFHTFKIRNSDGDDVFSRTAASSSFGSRTFTWTGVNSNPTAATGTYMFLFETAGSGRAAFIWTNVAASNYDIRKFSNKNFVEINSGVNDNQEILIQQR